MPGIVFDIQRFALHDGPGIRTTIFLKGCPLQCLWCHNPESQAHEPQLAFRSDRCRTTCSCVDACASAAHAIVDGRHVVDFSVPASEHTCIGVCPHGALSIIGRTMTVEEVMEEVLADRAYYERSGGGMTVSGGEPLAQFDFTLELLSEARRRGLHTCLDTSGMASRRRIEAVADVVDLFLYDYKATDPEEHYRLTGVRNELIVANLEYLYERGSRIIVRCPLIPGINDSDEHLAAIARMTHHFPDLERIEILPYHNMGRQKAAQVGMEYPLADQPSAGVSDVHRWKSMLGDAADAVTFGEAAG